MSAALATAASDRAVLDLKGLEADNLLAFVALLGLLRALETAQPAWESRVSWHQPPWTARLHLAESVDEAGLAQAANAGIEEIAEALASLGNQLHVVEPAAPEPTKGKSGARNTRTKNSSTADEKGAKDIWNVNFPSRLYRDLAAGCGDQAVAGQLLAALAGEHPVGREGYVAVSPYVLTRGQGHQRFLEDVFAMLSVTPPAGKGPAADRILELERALFQPWRRADARGGFRWDPAEDRRHALRFREPSKEGARTEIGAMRLAAVGFLSMMTCPVGRNLVTKGVVRTAANDLCFIWPLWTVPLTRGAVEVLLGHPVLLTEHPDLRRLAPLGVAEVMRAARVRAGKYTSIGRAEPTCGSGVTHAARTGAHLSTPLIACVTQPVRPRLR
jgi:hypothetical protein